MKKCMTCLVMLLVGAIAQAQSNSGTWGSGSAITLTPYVSEEVEYLPVEARATLQNKLSQLIVKQGVSSEMFGRFVLTANVVPLTQDITATAPPKYAYTLSINFFIGDGFDGKMFASYSTTIKGVGETETKAYMAAIKNIRTNDPELSNFISKGKSDIVNYYNSQIDRIIKEAQTLASQNKYDEALYMLATVPVECTQAYSKASAALEPMYKKYLDREGELALSQAKQLWNTHQDAETADRVAELLSEIDPSSSAYAGATELSETIAKRIKELDGRDWEFTLQQQKDDTEVEKEGVKAIKELLNTYAKNQPQTVYRVNDWK